MTALDIMKQIVEAWSLRWDRDRDLRPNIQLNEHLLHDCNQPLIGVRPPCKDVPKKMWIASVHGFWTEGDTPEQAARELQRIVHKTLSESLNEDISRQEDRRRNLEKLKRMIEETIR